ncbi:helix-turn-helix transcriptional regulator [Pseudomarimonas arenosa]|uniref:helix-turn-helix transcriptional regulator n=1 Tax=Pseudomarimonas arenosa TaxID=2774145 RepID=UPI001CDD4185|nr:helix-turn-helix transcriptional regulator [Pseudomarimonas arenosa]
MAFQLKGRTDGEPRLRFFGDLPSGWRHDLRDAVEENAPHPYIALAREHRPPLLSGGVLVVSLWTPRLLWGFLEVHAKPDILLTQKAEIALWAWETLHTYLDGEAADTGLLTPRERQCLSLAATGMTSTEIGQRLAISPRTIEGYLASACAKLHVKSRQAAVARALAHGLIDEDSVGRIEEPRGPYFLT